MNSTPTRSPHSSTFTESAIELTILMPCLNEAETLACCIQKAKHFLRQANIAGEILIADNGSVDGSPGIAQQAGARVVNVPTRGYGAALRYGIEQAKGTYVIMGDADDSYDFSNLSFFVEKLRAGYELVMGNRFKGKIEPHAMPFLNKYLGNPVLSFLGRIFFNSQVGDFHCGLRGFNRSAMRRLNLQADGMEFASEMVVKASLEKLKMTEVPTTLSPDGRSRRPHLRPWRDGWRHLRLLLLMCPRWLFLYPGLVSLIAGSLMMGVLTWGPFKIDRIVFDIHTLLFSSLFMIIGLQAILFFGLSRCVVFKEVKLFTLERGLILGSALVIGGCLGAIYAFLTWLHHAFGPLIPAEEMRILIPSFTFLISGIEIIFASFFASFLKQ